MAVEFGRVSLASPEPGQGCPYPFTLATVVVLEAFGCGMVAIRTLHSEQPRVRPI